jgi:hypothetical protein
MACVSDSILRFFHCATSHAINVWECRLSLRPKPLIGSVQSREAIRKVRQRIHSASARMIVNP